MRAMKFSNLDPELTCSNRLQQLNELDEFRLNANKNSLCIEYVLTQRELNPMH